ncbi:right-handed parallel beta-helix repeat-containing protein [Stigmatella sp. ncwal1]|uniref:Right-handed parallel beta-helix repeat-containing protein n=1 Tax=Stigmatella ashevillensis TaxID=2995309 RepID=A0ABT5D5Z4_9BACT|nr:right-handed parallel beta-helix repeat-containing protein [Stigmatella ashevillena]MDC0708273.1 right-handed parallel beta-helix repeat-containing protein [Stigmatella ashevillena]
MSSQRVFKSAVGVLSCLFLLACDTEGEWSSEDYFPQDEPLQAQDPAPSAPTGKNWFVSPQGSDEGRGTRESPLRTLVRATALAKAGDAIRVLPGVYAETLVLESKGSGDPVFLLGEGSPRPTLVPNRQDRGSLIRVKGRWRLENLHIDLGGAPMVAVVFENGGHHSVLSKSELHHGTAGTGVLVDGAENVTIQHNTLHHFIKPGDDSHGVTVVGPSRNVVIWDNDIHHNSGDSIQCQAGKGPAEAVLIDGNTLHEDGENGVDIKRCHEVTVRNNRLFGFPNQDIRNAGTSAGEAVVIHEAARGIKIQNNDISDAGRGISVVGDSTFPEGVWLESNTIQDIHSRTKGNGHGIRIEVAKHVKLLDNTLANTASYGMMVAADGKEVQGLIIRNNTLRGGAQSLLLRLGHERLRPGLILEGNRYARGGILQADGVKEKLSGTNAHLEENFSGERLTLSSQASLDAWRQVLEADVGAGLLE